MNHGQGAAASLHPGQRLSPETAHFSHHGAFHHNPPPNARQPLPQPPLPWPYCTATPHAVAQNHEQVYPPPFMTAAYHNTPPQAPTSPPAHQLLPSGSLTHTNSQTFQGRGRPLNDQEYPRARDASSRRPSLLTPPSAPSERRHFSPPVPWYSVPASEFPHRGRRKRRRKPMLQQCSVAIELPFQASRSVARLDAQESSLSESSSAALPPAYGTEIPNHSLESVHSPTPATSRSPSEAGSTQPTTPSSLPRPRWNQPALGSRPGGKIIPAVPVVHPHTRSVRDASTQDRTEGSREADSGTPTSPTLNPGPVTAKSNGGRDSNTASSNVDVKVTPKSWADLVKSNVPATYSANGVSDASLERTQPGVGATQNTSLAEVLTHYSTHAAGSSDAVSSLKPRGLVNTGNMCYMNSVLQVLIFCTPFYEFLNQISSFTAHSFRSSTPMIDGMINFFREFSSSIPANKSSVTQHDVQDKLLEECGESFTPDFLYDVIKTLPRFSTMRRGHQQDAEEFLGFLLEELHQECVKSMKKTKPAPETARAMNVEDFGGHPARFDDQGWLEVGPKQKAAVTRSSGFAAEESPITRIFGGKLRSELRVPGAKSSVTLEPYQSLQLDIGSPQVEDITDALKNLTKSELLQGDFSSPRGSGTAATKQVFMETIPPVLILHLKRFQYDNTGGTQKIWKTVGYPLELEISKEVFAPSKRARLIMAPLKYRLVGVIYHHGKNASGGHYTVDVRHQDGRTWIRLDDTVITRIRSEEVAVASNDQHHNQLEAAFRRHEGEQRAHEPRLDHVQRESQLINGVSPQKGRSHVHDEAVSPWNGSTSPANSTGKRTPRGHAPPSDNRVAYLLFYQRLGAAVQAAA